MEIRRNRFFFSPKRQAVGSNPAGITIFAYQIRQFRLKMAIVKLVGFSFSGHYETQENC